jgi:hypothetical protein
MISDEEYDKPSFEMPFVICLQEKLAPILKPQIYQNAYYGKDSTFSFVPNLLASESAKEKRL